MKPNRKVYQAPAVVYEGKVSTRSGSPIQPRSGESTDPANLFNK